MRFDRFCRKSASSVLSGDAPQTKRALTLSLLLLPVLAMATPRAMAGTPEARVPVGPQVVFPPTLSHARMLGRMSAETDVKVALSLPWRNSAALEALIHRQNDPKDPLYKKFLTHQQFVDRFAPTAADYDALKSWAATNGLSVAGTSPSRKLLIVSGKRDAVEAGFQVQLNRYQLVTGREVYANTKAPMLPQSVAARVSGVVGLSNYAQKRPFIHLRNDLSTRLRTLRAMKGLKPLAGTGTGAFGGLTPADIRSLYSINSLSAAGLDGSGQTIALYEQNGYDPTDIAAYAKAFGLFDPTAGPNPTLRNITIGGYDGTVTDPDTQGEVTLDIEMILAVAPKANILVYEFNDLDFSSSVNDLALEMKIADDNLAQVVSESYGLAEDDAQLGGSLIPENDVFKQMAVQGQSMFASSGDSAAYNLIQSSATPTVYQASVSDPASQPYVTGVGGTQLSTAPIVGGVATYGLEATWLEAGLPTPVGGGGGISKYWTKPDYQTGQGSSATMRDVPDVSLLAGPPGYTIYLASQGDPNVGATQGFTVVEGTSASCPLWAAFYLLVNQQRTIYTLSPIGFANPGIYSVAEGADYAADFHDINDGSTNLLYTAITGYDDATGWGSYIASSLLPEFAPTTFGSGTITFKASDTSGNPASGIAVAVTTPQIPSFRLAGTTAADGTLTITVPTGVHNFNNTGTDASLTFNVAAVYSGKSVRIQPASVVPPATVVLTLQAPDHTYTATTLQMIASPFDYSTSGDFAALFGLTTPLATTAGSPALYAWSPAVGSYLKYPIAPADTLRIGQGYWGLLPSNAYTRLIGVPLASGTKSYRINLLPGWNMIGDPFQGAVPMSGIQVDTVNPGTPIPIGAATTVQLPFYSYTGSAYQSLGTGDSLQPFAGYWVHATQAAELVIPAP